MSVSSISETTSLPAGKGRRLRSGSRDWRASRTKKEWVGSTLLLIFILIAVVGPSLAPFDPSQNSPDILSRPSTEHLLGTTTTGQDVFSQVLIGARSSVVVAFVSAALATALSIVIGISSGYLGSVVGELLSVVTSIFLVIPALPLAIIIAGYLPSRGDYAVAIVVAATGWAWGARALRAQTLSLRRRDFVVAARLAGEPRRRIVFFEIVPNVLPIIVSSFLFTVLYAIVTQASLAFLGLVDTSQWSWGSMLYWVQNFQAFTLGSWWWYVPPGLCIALLGTSLSLISLGIDERINPRLRAPAGAPRARRWKRDRDAS